MPYYIYKLKFTTPVRFGSDNTSSNLTTSAFTANSDTIFSAICNEWIRIHGEDELNRLIESALNSEFLISDTLPFRNRLNSEGKVIDLDLYIPKPVVVVERGSDVPESSGDSVLKKKMKKMTHISVANLKEYFQYLTEGVTTDFGMDKDSILMETQTVKASRTYEKEATPYLVSAVRFMDDAGLCFIVKMDDKIKEKFDLVVDSLGTTGIGGKRSSGYGKFSLEEIIDLNDGARKYKSMEILNSLIGIKGDIYISLSSILPNNEDVEIIKMENSYYRLIIRKGFVHSVTYSQKNHKRKQTVMIKSGSCFPVPLQGTIADLSDGGSHSVYRYGKGMYLGVSK